MSDEPRGFSRDDAADAVERLARRAVDAVLTLVRRGMALAGGVLMFTVVAVAIGFSLGLAALSDGMRTVWIVVGGFFGVLALGSVVVAMLRLRGIRSTADALVTEVTALIRGDRANERTIIETVEYTEGAEQEGVVVLSRQFTSMRDAVGDRVGDFRALTSALSAVTTFPGFMALATLISFVFLGLGLLFLIGLAI